MVKRWRSKGLKVVLYVDDGIYVGATKQATSQAAKMIRQDLTQAGFVIIYYMFRVLPFGLATAPFVFTKLLKPLHGKEMEKQRIKSCTVRR